MGSDAVLVVADDRAASEGLASLLDDEGFQVLTARDPTEALVTSDVHRPGAVVVDTKFAKSTGAELARRLKIRDPTAAVLLLTDPSSLEDAVAAAEALDGLLVKPLFPQVFVQAIRTALSSRALAAENRRLAADLARVVGREEARRPPVQPPDPSTFADQLDAALAQAQLHRTPSAVIVVEIGGWQAISDQLGPTASEEAAAMLKTRLAAGRRTTDLVGRISVDEFAIACADVRSARDCQRVVQIVLDTLESPITINGEEHWLSAKAGAVLTDTSSPELGARKVLRNAALALAFAHAEGSPWRLFEDHMLDRAPTERDMASEIREAMENEELDLVYHPVTELHSSRIVGAALRLRWNRMGESKLLSSELLSGQTDIALSARVSAWMLDRALAELASWRASQHLDDKFSLAIGVSARDAADPQFAEMIEELATQHEVPLNVVRIDLSSPAARQAASADFALGRLGDLGARFALDDFGGTEVNPSWLMRLPIETLKIDASLLLSLDSMEAPRGAALVRALVALGHELHLTVVGKGVTTATQRAALLAMGCEQAQHASFGRPGMPGEAWELEEAGRPGAKSA